MFSIIVIVITNRPTGRRHEQGQGGRLDVREVHEEVFLVMYIYIYIYIYKHMYTCVYIYKYIYVYTIIILIQLTN